MKFGLSDQALKVLCNVFKSHSEISKVQIFGSRALKTYRPNSDVDLVMWGNVDNNLLMTVNQELEELSLPYLFDLEIYTQITHPGLREHINKFGKDLYVKE